MRVGRYEILDIMGEGASGKVARAHDPIIDRTVAVKLLSQEFAKPAKRQQFLNEARINGQLSHPGIVALHDAGIDEATSTPYLVMEFIEGHPLDRLLSKGSLHYTKVCSYIGQAANALGMAHRKGVIHGDLKPSNLLITEGGSVKVTDFGMARLASREVLEDPMRGKPAYWCPEQIVARPQDARSDFFSLGTILFEAVTGKLPFQGETLQAICGQILSTPAPQATNLNPALPPALDMIILQCLSKNPAQRYATGEALADDLFPLARRKPAGPAVASPGAAPRRARTT
ncbi:MAG: serine/threonine protein kinase [Acidobacteriia bacterium]|nr:serine/threonine protein kinase [Terriglobia bacterium]